MIEWLSQHLVSRQGQPTTERHLHVLIPQYRLKSFPQKVALQVLTYLHVYAQRDCTSAVFCITMSFLLSSPQVFALPTLPIASSLLEECLPLHSFLV